MLSIPTLKMRELKDSVESMRIWADGEPDQFAMYEFTHELLKRNNITDDTFPSESSMDLKNG